MKKKHAMTYAESGVNYADMDPFKIAAQTAAITTAANMKFGFSEVTASRGESVYLIETNGFYLAHVEEGLGTKNLVADAMYKKNPLALQGYETIAIDTVAMIVNDMITLGALPLSVAMHLAVGSSDWFKDEKRYQSLVVGWKKGCDLAGCVWSCGETPTLKGIVNPETFVLSGSALGAIAPKKYLIQKGPQPGDVIILLDSSGIHANGLTLCREIADKLPAGYDTILPGSKCSYGDALLTPTKIYVSLIDMLQQFDINIHYTANITGHGWRKLMRYPGNLSYVIEKIPKPQEIFTFLQTVGPITDAEAYGNLNMGAGFALFVAKDEARQVMRLAEFLGFIPLQAGCVTKSLNRQVIIRPKNLVYSGETLQIR